ncbi:MAG: Adenylate/guanylate cyclase [Pedosphaera sp.]|nr:Adenylate/guanylate cyclase [Pedosphaera sp.]
MLLWFFCVRLIVKLDTLKRAPIFITLGVIGLVCLVQVIRPDVIERLEWMTYDWRVRLAAAHSPVVATNLGFVNISDETISDINKGLVSRPYGMYWPRHIYGRVVNELHAQGAKAVALDILFGELRTDHFPILVEGQEAPVESDDYFARQMKESGNVVIAAEQGVIPPPLFRTNALGLGDITAEKDFDGILRRAKAFRTYRKWHRAFQQVEKDPDYGVDLSQARVEGNQIVLIRSEGEPIKFPLDKDGNFDLADFVGPNIPPGEARHVKPFTYERVWHMGIVLAAQELKLDLANAEVNLDKGRIVLRGTNGVQRVIPVDKEGYFYINWCLTIGKGHLTQEPFEGLLAQYQVRLPGNTDRLAHQLAGYWKNQVDWRDKLVVVGSSAVGNDLTDRGATPLDRNTLLVSKHWNVANSVLTGQFVHRAPLSVELFLIVLAGMVAAFLTWIFRSHIGSFWILVASVAYVALAVLVYVQFRYWLPMALPVGAGFMVTHACLLAYLVIFEQAEQRRVKSVFSRVVSPAVVNELLKTEKVSLSGARRNVTVFFADIRGFTEMTDLNRDKAAEYVKDNNLVGEAAEAIFDLQARETLATVNAYLKVIAETVMKHRGTIDKFIGDCVMAFWGAPISNDKHAVDCVRAAIDVQRAVYRLNQERQAENERRELANLKLVGGTSRPAPTLPILSIGCGINTGVVTVGLMGSDEQGNYTVFGRDVNLASRLETVSGRGRIIISEATLAEIIQDDPTLALSCVELPPEKVKGIRDPVRIYEVPWRQPEETALSQEAGAGLLGGETSATFLSSAEHASGQ